LIFNGVAIPKDSVLIINADFDDHGFFGFLSLIDRHVQVHAVQLSWNGDDQHDDQHQQNINQWRGVDVHHDIGLGIQLGESGFVFIE
jgi:hypothetical protein